MNPNAQQRPPLRQVFEALAGRWGPQHWWPARTRFEMCVGAILTQNTAWKNVEKAVANLRRAGALEVRALHDADPRTLAGWIRPAGCFHVKARRLRAFTTMLLDDFGGSTARLFALPTDELRKRLLAVNGIGPETADCMVLYAARRPVFVVDAYTRRFMSRHGWASPDSRYDALAAVFTSALPRDEKMYNEYHALIVALGKEYCRARPACGECPLRTFLPAGGPLGE